MPEDEELDDLEVREEDAADVAARKRAAAKAREEAELRKRSQARHKTCFMHAHAVVQGRGLNRLKVHQCKRCPAPSDC